MATSTSVPLEEYLRTSYEPDMEYVDGELVERHVGERKHSRLQLLLGALLAAREAQGRFHVYTEQRLRVSARGRHRIPDVCLMALPYEYEPVFTKPPHLVVEIVSPDDRPADILLKVADYLNFGVAHIWMPDPYKRKLQEADSAGLRDCPDLVVETELAGRVDFRELFARLDEPQA
ncbi:MAG: Uma2 family endonuclease [Bryobacteraceae bacterium]